MKISFYNKRLRISVIAIVTVLAIIFSTVLTNTGMLGVKADNVWNGSISVPTQGDGSEANPYLITTAEELAYLAKTGGDNKYYKLTNDIYLNDINKINWHTGVVSSGYTPNLWYTSADTSAFHGHLDGDGHIVYGLYAKTTSNVSSALFPKIQENNSESIKNLGIESAFVSVGYTGAAFVGETVSSGAVGTLTIENCFAGENVTINAKVAGVFYGRGGCRYTIRQCYSLASVTGTTKWGIVAETWGSSRNIVNCYIVNTGITAHGYIDCMNVCTTDRMGGNGVVLLSDDNMQGLDVLTSDSKMKVLASCDAFVATETYPKLKCFENFVPQPKPDDEISGDIWSGNTKKPKDAAGNEANPILIETAEELAYIVKNGSGNKYYKLTKDIYLNDINKINWSTGVADSDYIPNSWYISTNSGVFSGTFDGDGHTIYGLYVNTTSNVSSALFPKIQENNSESIKNLGINSAYISVGYTAAAFVGETVSAGTTGKLTIENCFVGLNVIVNAKIAGAFYGRGAVKFSIDKCYTLAKVKGSSKQGLVAETWGSTREISNVYAVDTAITNHGSIDNLSAVYVTKSGGGSGYNVRIPEYMQGIDVLTNDAKMSELADCGAFVATESYPILKIFSTEEIPDEEEIIEGEIWSGKVAKKIATGKGTKKDPYIITNGAELAYAIKSKGLDGSYFELANDIYLNDISDIKWAENTKNNKWVTCSEFYGYIDGCGFAVYGVWFSKENAPTYAGLISVFNKGYVKNLGVRYAQVVASSYAGGIIGRTSGSGMKTVDQCFVDESVSVTYTTDANGCAGGIMGCAGYEPVDETILVISNCYSKARLYGSNSSRTNGIIGTAWQCSYKMFNCYSKNFAPYSALNKDTCSHLNEIGVKTEEIYKNIYTDATKPKELEVFEFIADGENLIGENAKSYMSGLDYESVFEIVENSTPKLKVFKNISGEDVDLTGDSQVYTSGKGTKKDPFIISNAKQLGYLVQSENTKGKYYKLANDIYVNDTTNKNWKTNNPSVWYTNENSATFAGYIDGNGYSINGLYLNQTPEHFDDKKNNFLNEGTALFPVVSTTAVIRNIHIRNSYLSAKGYVGSVVGKIVDVSNGLYTQVVGCSADESVEIKGQVAGGLVAGRTDRGLKLYYCYFTGTLSATSSLRGNAFVGDLYGRDWEVVECYGANYRLFLVKPNLVAATYCTESTEACKTVKPEEMIGENAKKSMKEFEWDIWKTVKDSTPALNIVPDGRVPKVFDEGVKGRVWSGYRATMYAGGDGTKNNPYIIETPEQMAMLVTATDTKGKYYKLTADLKLNDTSLNNWKEKAKEWFTGATDFAGYFDGDGHVVSGLYYNTSFVYAGLFPSITSGAVIEKLGITQSYIYNYGEDNKNAYGASLVGYVREYEIPDEVYVRPRMSMCFADHTVTIESYNAGGLISGCSKYIDMDNCYFTGNLTTMGTYGAQAIANSWNSKIASNIKNCYFVSDAGYPVVDHDGGAAIVEIENVYYQGERGTVNGATNIASMIIRGKQALETMPGLDYNKIWKIVEGGTPVLRCFKNAEKYSCNVMPEKVEISFASQGGSSCESLFGYPYHDKLTVDMLPTPTRYGYEFGGWYYFKECVVPVEDGLFPNFSTFFYAKWIPAGFITDFEKNLDPKYDYNSGAEHYKPGITGYISSFVNEGLKAIHTMSGQQIAPRFLLSYENKLEKGQVYDVVFWICTDSKEVANTSIKLLHAKDPQVDSDTVGYNQIKVKNIKKGVWQKVETQITANTEYLIFETDNQNSLYFDNIQIVGTGKTGKLGMLSAMASDIETENNNIGNIIIIITLSAVVLLIAVVVAIIVILKKRNAVKK